MLFTYTNIIVHSRCDALNALIFSRRAEQIDSPGKVK